MHFNRLFTALVIGLIVVAGWNLVRLHNSEDPELGRVGPPKMTTRDAAIAEFYRLDMGDLSNFTITDHSDPILDYDEFGFTPKNKSLIGPPSEIALGVERSSLQVMLLSD